MPGEQLDLLGEGQASSQEFAEFARIGAAGFADRVLPASVE
ncbi:hypothetical protein [Streptomyces canus]|nr:hypothetical protein [Streptomyces canus]